MRLNKEQLQELKDYTWHNNHTEARLILAGYIEHAGLIKAYKAIQQLHDFFGDMPHHLGLFRNDLDAILFNVAAHKIKNFDKVHKCF